MGLRLHTVAAGQGLNWVRLGMTIWARRPLAFTSLLLFYLMTAMLLALLLPYLGAMLGLALLPMLSLGFMIATRSTQNDQPVHALQLIEGLRTVDARRRRSQLVLCASYALCSLAVMGLANWVDDGLFLDLQRLLATQTQGNPSPEMRAVITDPRLASGMWVRLGLIALVSVPFWHASALVHWGGQSAVQALFSSTLALWRARGAFAVYMMALTGLSVLVVLAVGLASTVIDSRDLLGLFALGLALGFSALFYVTLWFSFNDSFGADMADQPGPAAPTDTA